MEISITSETVSWQTICGDPENIEIANDTEPKTIHAKHMTIMPKDIKLTWRIRGETSC